MVDLLDGYVGTGRSRAVMNHRMNATVAESASRRNACRRQVSVSSPERMWCETQRCLAFQVAALAANDGVEATVVAVAGSECRFSVNVPSDCSCGGKPTKRGLLARR